MLGLTVEILTDIVGGLHQDLLGVGHRHEEEGVLLECGHQG